MNAAPDPYQLEGRLTCQCQVCATWRRLGAVISARHQSERFHLQAKEVLRTAFSDLLDVAGDHHPWPTAPVAAGSGGPQTPPPLHSVLPETREPAGLAPGGERSPKATSAKDLPREGEKKEENKDRSRRRRRRASREKDHRKASKERSQASRSHQSELRTASSKSAPAPVKVKEEPEEESPPKSPVSPADKGDKASRTKEKKVKDSRTPSRKRSKEKEDSPPNRGKEKKKKDTVEDNEPPPGTWTLRPRSPDHPPPRRPAEPAYPPRWSTQRSRPTSRSKGIKRDVRNADINEYGCDPERKRWREERHRTLMESVSSMDSTDEQVMSSSYGDTPWHIDAGGLGLCHRPRLYWIDWELPPGKDYEFGSTPLGRATVKLVAHPDVKTFLTPGWERTSPDPLPTFTTSRPRQSPGYKPAGIQQCNAQELALWQADEYRFPPYQYQVKHCLKNRKGTLRVPNIQERETLMGFPKDYTVNCLPKAQQGSVKHTDLRLSLIGNTWNVMVVSWLLSKLGFLLGLNPDFTVGEIVQRTSPGATTNFLTYLQRPSMRISRGKTSKEQAMKLVHKFLKQVSLKGEDIMLQAGSEDLTKYHRLRASVPARLWRWQTAASWAWSSRNEHINALELRAVLTSLRWRIERQQQLHAKFVHLVDSLVVLHALSRGRSSSRKLRRTMLRVNSLLLATKSQAVWAYVHTKLNPADAPSRRPQKRKWKSCRNAA
eukprot:Skav221253  [mRNA]  locus=scaffold1045:682679:688780:+ [translate_table: standard]